MAGKEQADASGLHQTLPQWGTPEVFGLPPREFHVLWYANGLASRTRRLAMKWFVLPILVLPFLAGCAGWYMPLGWGLAGGLGGFSTPALVRSERIEELGPGVAQCDAEAQFTVGYIFLTFEDMEEEGVKLLTVAAQQGHAASQYWLGRWYGGKGWTSLELDRVRDPVKAYLLVSLAALQEYQCIRHDPLLAPPETLRPVDFYGRRRNYGLYQFLARAEYFACAAETREEFAGNMTPEQIAEAEKLIQEWEPQECVREGDARAIAE